MHLDEERPDSENITSAPDKNEEAKTFWVGKGFDVDTTFNYKILVKIMTVMHIFVFLFA